MAHEAVSFPKGAHHSLVIGRMLGQICCPVLLLLPGLRCCVAKTPVVFGAHCVSIPAHLQPSCRSDPNPVKGVLGPLPSGRVLLRLSHRDQSENGYLSYGFDIYHPGDKKLILSPREAS